MVNVSSMQLTINTAVTVIQVTMETTASKVRIVLQCRVLKQHLRHFLHNNLFKVFKFCFALFRFLHVTFCFSIILEFDSK